MTAEQKEQWNNAYRPKNGDFHDQNLSGKAEALWKLQRYLSDYMGTIAAVDEGIGEVLDYLKAAGLEENTIVVYTSDQGFYLGEHGWFDKRFMYEESKRPCSFATRKKSNQDQSPLNRYKTWILPPPSFITRRCPFLKTCRGSPSIPYWKMDL